VWELPVLIHLPLAYALAVPLLRVALTQWMDRPAAWYRRAFGVAATGLGYGCAASVFRAMIPAGVPARHYLMSHTALWLLAVACCALAQWAVRQALQAPLRAPADQAAATRPGAMRGNGAAASGVSRESLRNDAAELCATALVALSIQVTPLALVIAFPMGTLLQRSSRHHALVNEARVDAKTGLLNVAAWERGAALEVARAVRTSTPLAVALLDLDRFKQINDTYGHLLGDEVLRQIAATMTDNLRDYDLAGRFGGEEFVVLLPQTRAVDALRIAERVRAQIARLPVYAGEAERVPVTASIGVAALDAGSCRELRELLAAADAALYRAKASGRDQVQMISTSRGLSAVRPPSILDPDAALDYPLVRFSGDSRPDDLSAPGLRLGMPGPLAPEPLPGAVAGQLAEAEGATAEGPAEEGAGVEAGMASTATSSALVV
jgi:diguanylate cyclase (GGDEF)-like protein